MANGYDLYRQMVKKQSGAPPVYSQGVDRELLRQRQSTPRREEGVLERVGGAIGGAIKGGGRLIRKAYLKGLPKEDELEKAVKKLEELQKRNLPEEIYEEEYRRIVNEIEVY